MANWAGEIRHAPPRQYCPTAAQHCARSIFRLPGVRRWQNWNRSADSLSPERRHRARPISDHAAVQASCGGPAPASAADCAGPKWPASARPSEKGGVEDIRHYALKSEPERGCGDQFGVAAANPAQGKKVNPNASTANAHKTYMSSSSSGSWTAKATMKNAAVSSSTSLLEIVMVSRSDDAAQAMPAGNSSNATLEIMMGLPARVCLTRPNCPIGLTNLKRKRGRRHRPHYAIF